MRPGIGEVMHYISTRGGAPKAGFDEVLMRALAPDGGLYVPESWPEPRDWSAFRGAPFAEVAAEILHLFAGGSLGRGEAASLCEAAYATFRHDVCAPLVEVGEERLLELFHGPTLAFKDVAMQLIARLFERELDRRGGRMTVIVATSGDTGGAAVSALAGRDNLTICALHPHRRISEVQRRFMTTSGAANVLNLAVEGTFDDCQAIVKTLFADRSFASEVSLGGVNSINWARITAQVTYYVTAALAVGEAPVHFSVPTGNFGDVFAGYVARRLGAPVGRLIVAVNENDILDRALRTGRYARQGIVPTTSPSMDIEVASNFERLIFEASGRDAAMTATLMAQLKEQGGFDIPADLLGVIAGDFLSRRASQEEVAAEMRRVWREHAVLIDPHTAVGTFAARQAREAGLAGPVVTLATAHPAKFPDAVRDATGQAPLLPTGLEPALYGRPEVFSVVPADPASVKASILARNLHALTGG